MTDDFSNNKPMLRKIKRPKQHNPENREQIRPVSPQIPQAPKPAQPSMSREIVKNNNFGNNTGRDVFNIDNILDKKLDRGFITDEDIAVQEKPKFFVGNLFTLNFVILFGIVTFALALIIGNFMFSAETVVRDGLQGVVMNPEIPTGRARCGKAERTQGCVLYVMNPQNQELNARDFFDLASQLTGRQRFMIETGNMRYSTIKIKPGAIAQFNIPPLVN